MIIIVSGDIGVGKSTVCRKLTKIIRDKGLSCGGIMTFKSEKGHITIEDIRTGKTMPLASKAHGTTTIGPSTARYLFNQNALNFGNRVIEEAATANVTIIDEIGQLELRSEGLVTAINIIKAKRFQNCIIVIRKSLLPFYLPHFNDPNTHTLEVTTENRDTLPQEISELFQRKPS